jgi:Trk K+ transport system NAD-binding subunit
MDMFDSLMSISCRLNEQLGREVFEVLPENGPIIAIINRDGNCWPSDSERFSTLNISEDFFKELCAKVDDGEEPVITEANESSIVAAQLATEKTNCGYLIIALPGYSVESALVNINLIEILLSQISLIAKLIEKNNLLYELQMKQFSEYQLCETPLN